MSFVGIPDMLAVFSNAALEQALPRLVGILGILVVFGLIITFHEFGHFLAAKLSKMGVHEFSIGFGPALFSRRRGETTYSIRAIPLGGYVRIAGMELEDSEDERKAPNSFFNKPYYAKFITILAGALMNFVLALIVFAIIYTAIGSPKPGNTVYIAGVQPYSPAEKAGVKAGDVIVEVNGVRNPASEREAVEAIRQGQPPVKLVVDRRGEQLAFTIETETMLAPERHAGGWLYRMREYNGIGIVPDNTSGERERYSLGKSVVMGAEMVAFRIKDAVAQLASLIMGYIPANQITSILGIGKISYDTAQGAVSSHAGLATYLGLIGTLSIFIGFFNLLPIPALDGSHLLFLTVEAIRRKPFDKKKLAMVHMVGMMLLLSLVLLVTVKDAFQIFGR